MVFDYDISNIQQHIQDSQHWINSVYQGIANSQIAETTSTTTKVVCPAFGQPGWAPFCFLNGNPVFNAFDSFQAFIQNLVVTLHDFLEVQPFFRHYLLFALI
jgi:hypothetical protein